MRTILFLILMMLAIAGCMPGNDQGDDYTNLPYPKNEDILFYQSEVDSGYQTFWTDIKTTASAYMNNSKYDIYDVAPEDIILVGEGLFRGTVEVETRDFILVLKFERPNKSIGRRSIWQVRSAEEKPWPEKALKSEKSK